MPATIVCFASVFFNIGANKLLIHGLGGWQGLGFIGSPLATALSFCFQITVFGLYAIVYKGYHRPHWGGYSTRGFTQERILTFVSLVVPMTLGNAIESWGYQISTLASGNMGSAAVASMSIMYKVW